jgi:hypothetical protein
LYSVIIHFSENFAFFFCSPFRIIHFTSHTVSITVYSNLRHCVKCTV